MYETVTDHCDQRGCEADEGYGCTGHTTEVNHWLDVTREVMHLHQSDGADSPFCLECGHSFPCNTQRLLHSEPAVCWCGHDVSWHNPSGIKGYDGCHHYAIGAGDSCPCPLASPRPVATRER